MLLSIVTFILGIVFSYLISRNFELKTQIRMMINSFGIINSNVGIQNVAFQCNNRQIDTLTKTTIMFWNSGRKCITKDDVLGQQNLKIEFPSDVEIFECVNKRVNEVTNEIKCHSNNNFVIIEFDYLKPGNGAIIDILHSGQANQKIAPILKLKSYNKDDVVKYETSIDWEDVHRKNRERDFMKKIIWTLLMIALVIASTFFSIFVPMFCIDDFDVAMLVAIVLEFICGGLSVLLIMHIKNSFYLKPIDLN